MEYFATGALGTEPATALELKALGFRKVRSHRGGVAFEGGTEAGMRACLHLRTAMRVLRPLATFPAADAEALYRGVHAIAWEEHLTNRHTFAVEAMGGNDALRHTGFIALKSKDAIADAMRRATGARPNVDAKDPDVPIVVHVGARESSVSLDLSGAPLHRRGYRPREAEAPLKESLAAALLLLAGYSGDEPFCDPMAGSGTLLVEAAWIAMRRAPGLKRHFAFERAPGFGGAGQSMWHRMLHEAEKQVRRDGLPEIVGRDVSTAAITQAKESLSRAGATARLEKGDVRDLRLPPSGGLVVTNPPYAERLGGEREVLDLYREIGRVSASWKSWRVHVLSGHPGFVRLFGRRPAHRLSLFNGPIACEFLSYPPVA